MYIPTTVRGLVADLFRYLYCNIAVFRSHEIRTPLNAVLGYTDLMISESMSKEGPLTDKHKDYLKIIRQSGELLMAVVSDILDISKIEAGQLQIDCQPFSIQETLQFVEDSAKVFQNSMITGRKVEVELTSLSRLHQEAELGGNARFEDVGGKCKSILLDDDSCLLMGDPARIQQVLLNLISNAIKFTSVQPGSTAGRVEYGAQVLSGSNTGSESFIEFFVADDGVGIPEETQNSIFEAFRQAHPSRDSHELGGTGLGLTISKRLVELMGGEMRLWSSTHSVHHGTVIYFTIPYRPFLVSSMKRGDQIVFTTKGVLKKVSPHSRSTRLADSNTTISSRRSTTTNTTMGGAIGKAIGKAITDAGESTAGILPLLPSVAVQGRGKVLVVDDNKINLKLAVRIVNRLGYETDTAVNGQEAVDKFKADDSNSIRLILLDKEMPVMDGLEAVRAIRRIEQERTHGTGTFRSNVSDLAATMRVPVVALTAAAYKEDEEACLVAGCDAFLTKPVKQEALKDILSSYRCGNCPAI